MVNTVVLLVGLLGIDLQYRVPNDDVHGQCYWACTDSICGTRTMDLSLATGVGLDGAKPEDIEFMCWVFGIKKLEMLTVQSFEEKVEGGTPVIALMQPWNPQNQCHAIIGLDVQWVRKNRVLYKRVKYYDPNHVENQYMAWDDFVKKFRRGHILEKQ